jgi:hypothetical protein
MKYFFDTEFIEDGKTIDLISIGVVAEDGREFYAVNSQCDLSKSSEWVELNVLHPMGLAGYASIQEINTSSPYVPANTKNTLSYAMPKHCIGQEIFQFMAEDLAFQTIEFWAYYADYDWVALCQLYGTMMDLPEGFPMYCHDLKQEADRLGVDLSSAVPQENEHHALADARWNKRAYKYLVATGQF